MSIISIFVGQCGNQVGNTFFQMLEKEKNYCKEIKKSSTSHFSTFFHACGYGKCIMVDSEPKVIQKILPDQYLAKFFKNEQKSKYHGFYINPENVAFEQSGCGNNWAMGYQTGGYVYTEAKQKQNKNRLLKRTLSIFRKEMERSDMIQGIMVFHSLSGGTGSGLGSKLIEQLKLIYPELVILSIAVFPFVQGESPLQSYNSMLSIAHIEQFADAILLFQNDLVLKSLSKNSSKKQFSTEDVNQHIALCLMGLFAPMKVISSQITWKQFHLPSFVSTLCPSKEFKFLEAHLSENITNMERLTSWPYIVEHLAKRIPQYSSETSHDSKNVSLFNHLTVRGEISSLQDVTKIETVLTKALEPVDWIQPRCMEMLISSSTPAFKTLKIDYLITVCTNRSSIIEPFHQVLQKSYYMLQTDAYLHWYARFDCSKQWFLHSFAKLLEIIQRYKEAISIHQR